MSATQLKPDAALSGTFSLGGDLTIHRLGYGAMRLTGEGIWGEPKDHDESMRVLKRLADLNVNFIDTADSYGPYVSEQLIGDALSPYTGGMIVGTKGGLLRTGPNQWIPLGNPDYIKQEIELSLRRLKTDVIDLYQLHRIDSNVPAADTLGAIKEAQDAGKIRHVGLSEVGIDEIKMAQKILPIVSVQNEYNLTQRKCALSENPEPSEGGYCDRSEIDPAGKRGLSRR